ncbi:MAG: MBL fold metallo-hydrolase [Leptolyngbyaceae cyanobacterium bins.59]|nr:MBL fold metallo-hydrolase [Leptolyngbyaceae cyanobacterium bins.59]
MQLTWIDLNTWIVQIAGQTVLIDPWLVDPLIFYGQPWLFTAYHVTPPRYSPETLPPIDLILISQGLDDHCHRPTLERLDRTIPVLVSPTAEALVRSLSYQQVIPLEHAQIWTRNSLKITAVPGAPLQPGQIENGYLLEDLTAKRSLYYEPHLFRPEVWTSPLPDRVDVAIAPVVGQVFPLMGELIMGPQAALKLIKRLKPMLFLPTTVGEVNASGILPRLIRTNGSVSEFKNLLDQEKVPTSLMTLNAGETVDASPMLVAAP